MRRRVTKTITRNHINIPDDNKKGPSLLGIIITAMIPPIWPITLFLILKKIMHAAKQNKLNDYRNYASVINVNSQISAVQIAQMTGRPLSVVLNDLQAMVTKGYLGPQAYLDRSTNILHVYEPTTEVVEEYEVTEEEQRESRKTTVKASPARNEKAPGPAQKAKNTQSEKRAASTDGFDASAFEATLKKIRDLNDRIEDKAVSERIDRIGMLTAGIFSIVQLKPERADEVRKFMDYYLPTTFKLLETYALMEKQAYQSDSIRASRKKVEDILDTLITAFQKQQDILFKTEALNIDVDIQVLENMMAKDGLVLPKGADINQFRVQQQGDA